MTNALFTIIIPKLTEKVKNKLRFLIIVDLINGIAFILMGLTTNLYIGILLILVIVSFGYPRFLIYVNGINRQIEADERATVLSTINMFGSFFMALLNLLVGFIGSLNIFYVFILVGTAIIIFTIFTRAKSEYL
ncbi:MAG: hypothetical protein ACTSP9_06115 [Promethearchaeota archaeon]